MSFCLEAHGNSNLFRKIRKQREARVNISGKPKDHEFHTRTLVGNDRQGIQEVCERSLHILRQHLGWEVSIPRGSSAMLCPFLLTSRSTYPKEIPLKPLSLVFSQDLRFLLPKAIKGMVFGTRNLKHGVLGPSGFALN